MAEEIDVKILSGWGVPKKKIKHIPLSIDYKLFSKKLDAAPILKKYDIPKGKKILLFLAVITPRKRPDILLKAAQELILAKQKNFHIIFAGPDKLEQEGWESLPTLIEKQGLKDYCTLTGTLDSKRVHEIMSISDIGICTSWHEGNPRSVAEYGAGKLALCLSKIPGLIEYDGCALFHKVGDYKKLAEDIKKYISDKRLFDADRQKAYKFISSTRDYDNISSQLKEWFTT